ncbi:hypothetical protein [Burkholderia cenocepacia]|uniref:hypothetical protein n=1 Tax=Burkholderia cenocepacia TaxID=95486 RepID=UPI000761DC17|nr:hypothetical protein [Burkholderia cenocepacia]KWU23387.1 hypothetical protein AS149_36985 [Burkholderia cenocepacia]
MLDRICAAIVSAAALLIQVCGCVAAAIGACALFGVPFTPVAICVAAVVSGVLWFVGMPVLLWQLVPRKVLMPHAQDDVEKNIAAESK